LTNENRAVIAMTERERGRLVRQMVANAAG
jgi:hypothetical protein